MLHIYLIVLLAKMDCAFFKPLYYSHDNQTQAILCCHFGNEKKNVQNIKYKMKRVNSWHSDHTIVPWFGTKKTKQKHNMNRPAGAAIKLGVGPGNFCAQL